MQTPALQAKGDKWNSVFQAVERMMRIMKEPLQLCSALKLQCLYYNFILNLTAGKESCSCVKGGFFPSLLVNDAVSCATSAESFIYIYRLKAVINSQ